MRQPPHHLDIRSRWLRDNLLISEAVLANRRSLSTLERAIAIAAEAHAGQVDKARAPYVLHPLRMILAMSLIDDCIVAA
jgi:(p)ppGpp synthase/HD superfamily hydrolase